MKNLGHEFNLLEEHRYAVTTTYNDTFQAIVTGALAGSTWEPIMAITYHQVAQAVSDIYSTAGTTSDGVEPAPASQQARNVRSTLHSYLAFVGKTLESRVGVELTVKFHQTVSEYLKAIDVSGRTKRDRKHHLNVIYQTYEGMIAGANTRPKKETTLCAELRLAVANSGIPPKTLAKKAGVSPSALQRWLAGAMPNQRGLVTLRRVESHLGLERDSLTRHVIEDKATEKSEVQKVEYREKLRHRCTDTYYLPLTDINASLQREWKALFDHKTSVAPAQERSVRGVWRMIPQQMSDIKCALVTKGDAVSPAALIVLNYVRGFVGFLMRPISKGGWGLSSDDAQTLAWFAHPDAVSSYLEFMTERSNGVKHGGQKILSLAVSALVRERTGYVRQRADLCLALPEAYRPVSPETWQTMCDRTYKLAKAWARASKETHRSPDEPIAPLLALEEPLLPVLEAIKRIERNALAALPGSKVQAILKRGALLLALLVSNPLRARTIQSLTVKSNNAGSVYRTPQGWRIRLSKSQLKNGHGAAGNRYDVAIAPWVSEMLDEYVEEHRPVLASADNSYLFPSSRSEGIWADLGKHVMKLTKRYIDGCCGISPHSFRHLVATAWLKRYPNSFMQVAELLNDRLETVMNNYAHLKRDDSLSMLNAHLDSLRGKVK